MISDHPPTLRTQRRIRHIHAPVVPALLNELLLCVMRSAEGISRGVLMCRVRREGAGVHALTHVDGSEGSIRCLSFAIFISGWTKVRQGNSRTLRAGSPASVYPQQTLHMCAGARPMHGPTALASCAMHASKECNDAAHTALRSNTQRNCDAVCSGNLPRCPDVQAVSTRLGELYSGVRLSCWTSSFPSCSTISGSEVLTI
jgi:hypothetical protein